MEEAIIIRAMQPADLDFAAACTAAEGWSSEIRREFEGFFAHDPQGCLIAEAGGQPIGIGVATSYGAAGFVGELIVVPAWRGRGVGRRLLEQAVGYLQARGAHSIYLDGVPAAVSLYERAGFRKVCRSLRFIGSLPGQKHPGVCPMRPEHLPDVSRLDRQAFGADRGFFLARRLALYPERCYVLEEAGDMAGFIMGRQGGEYVPVGPWLARPGVAHPERLLESLAAGIGGRKLAYGVLDTNRPAVELARALGLNEVPAPPWRMALGPAADLGTSPELYAIGSAAKG
jgi:ribosomal protein S18 acetylase RimI-like enzyme